METISKDNTNKKVTLEKPDTEKSENKANHKRGYWVEKTRKKLGQPNDDRNEYPFEQIVGLTGDWSVGKIKQRYHKCKKADIPFAPLWWHLYGKDKEDND